ncbi:MAG TPA: hypothetical protein VL357_03040 [Rariglobus sp.]|jgi:hypothetical protein|nr:hypothetical protein [Rariglobus sp.]
MIASQKSSLAAAAALVASLRRGVVTHIAGYNAKATAQFIQLHDAADVPPDAVAGVAEISTVDTTGLTAAGLGDKYFLLSGASGDFYVWFNLDAGGTDPALDGKTGIEVALTTGDSVSTIATAIAAAIDAIADFGATALVNVVTITDAATGARTDIAAGDSGLAVAVDTQGVTEIAAAIPLAVITVPGSSNFQIPLPATGLACENGVTVCNSSTYATKTAGSEDCFFTVAVI